MKDSRRQAPAPPRPDWVLVAAGTLGRGQLFAKRTAGPDGFAYLVISTKAFRPLGLGDPDPDFVYGVCYNGGMTRVTQRTLVWLVPPRQMDVNRGAEVARGVACSDDADPGVGGDPV